MFWAEFIANWFVFATLAFQRCSKVKVLFVAVAASIPYWACATMLVYLRLFFLCFQRLEPWLAATMRFICGKVKASLQSTCQLKSGRSENRCEHRCLMFRSSYVIYCNILRCRRLTYRSLVLQAILMSALFSTVIMLIVMSQFCSQSLMRKWRCSLNIWFNALIDFKVLLWTYGILNRTTSQVTVESGQY